MDARTLVCGSKGFIGGNLYKALCDEDQGRGAKTVKVAEGNLTLPIECHWAVQGIETVYMMAGTTGGVGLLAADPLSMVTPNIVINANMFQACQREGVKRIICMSSTTGYPDATHALTEDEYFKGDVIPGYYNPGTTRRFIERLGGMYKDMSVIFLRCAGAYGPGDDFEPDTSHVVGATIRKVVERQNPLKIWGDGKDVRDVTYIDDLVRALILCRDLEGHHAINIGQGCGVSINTIVNTICEIANHRPELIHEPRESIMRLRILNIKKARDLLGWEPTIPMEIGFEKTLGWYENIRLHT